VDALIAAAQQGDLSTVRRLLKEIDREYQPPAQGRIEEGRRRTEDGKGKAVIL